MKKIIIVLSALAVVLSLSACEKTKNASTADEIDENSANTVSQTVQDTTEAASHTTGNNADSSLAETTEAKTTGVVGDPKKQVPTAITGTTLTDAFIVRKVSGTYLELSKVIYGEDTEKLIYSCNYGELDGSDDMHFNVGDVVTIRYDREIAETYPLQLTVREIYPAAWN